MRNRCLLILLFTMTAGMAQKVETIQHEIDVNLWKPFQAAFEALDAPKLNALYGQGVLRVTPNGIDTEDNFKEANIKRLEGHKASNTSLELDFWLESRHTNTNTSYEVGFYRMRLTNSEGVNDIYGQFHIVLEKINGEWKITQDWDTASINGKTLSAEDFEKQPAKQFE